MMGESDKRLYEPRDGLLVVGWDVIFEDGSRQEVQLLRPRHSEVTFLVQNRDISVAANATLSTPGVPHLAVGDLRNPPPEVVLRSADDATTELPPSEPLSAEDLQDFLGHTLDTLNQRRRFPELPIKGEAEG